MSLAISLVPFHYKGAECIGINIGFTSEIEKEVRSINNMKWSIPHKMWYLPLSKESYDLILAQLKDRASVDISKLKTYLQQRKTALPLVERSTVSKARAQIMIQYPLSAQNLESFFSVPKPNNS